MLQLPHYIQPPHVVMFMHGYLNLFYEVLEIVLQTPLLFAYHLDFHG